MDYNHPRDDKSGRDSSQCYTYFNVCVCGGGGGGLKLRLQAIRGRGG